MGRHGGRSGQRAGNPATKPLQGERDTAGNDGGGNAFGERLAEASGQAADSNAGIRDSDLPVVQISELPDRPGGGQSELQGLRETVHIAKSGYGIDTKTGERFEYVAIDPDGASVSEACAAAPPLVETAVTTVVAPERRAYEAAVAALADPAAFDEQAVLLQAAVLELLGNQWAYPSVKFPDGMMNFGETRDLRTLAEEWAKGKLGKE